GPEETELARIRPEGQPIAPPADQTAGIARDSGNVEPVDRVEGAAVEGHQRARGALARQKEHSPPGHIWFEQCAVPPVESRSKLPGQSLEISHPLKLLRVEYQPDIGEEQAAGELD